MIRNVFFVFFSVVFMTATLGLAEEAGSENPSRKLPLLSEVQDKATAQAQLDDLLAIAGYLSQAKQEFEALTSELEKKRDPANAALVNASTKTLAMLSTLLSMYTKWGGKINPSAGRGRFDFTNFYDPEYFKKLRDGLENYGYQDVSGKPLGLGIDFFLSAIPAEAQYLTKGEYQGFFQMANGDMIIPGLKFYHQKKSL